MSWETIEEKNGFKIQATPDLDPDNPIEHDELVRLVYRGTARYLLGNEPFYPNKQYESGEQQCREKYGEAFIVKPVYAYIHSGTALAFSPFSCPWDSGQSGFVWISKKAARENFGVKRLTSKHREILENMLPGWLRAFEAYLNGDVYGFRVVNPEGTETESCWGYLGGDHEASGLLDAAREFIPEEVAACLS
jgi:hypothetical protein